MDRKDIGANAPIQRRDRQKPNIFNIVSASGITSQECSTERLRCSICLKKITDMAKLRPRARIVRTIGDQLISGPEAALIELVKNAYDADSPTFDIKITPPGPSCPVGALFVRDHGHGMSGDDIINKWFEPATDYKLKQPYSPKGRRMLGAKGIGRFAASRLGTKTVLQSVTVKTEPFDQEAILVQIDWNEFEADRYLEDIDVPIKQMGADAQSLAGVSLAITDLRDTWSKKQLSNLIRELRRVLAPNEAGNAFEIRLDLSDFTVDNIGFDGRTLLQQLNIDVGTSDLPEQNDAAEDRLSQVIVPFKLQDHGDYRLKGSFDIAGKFTGIFVVNKGDGVEHPITIAAPEYGDDELDCGPLSLELNVFDREAESVAELFKRMNLPFDKIGIRAARQILTDNAGIAIFRNGFRIRPYGEPENDWLELERMRVQDPSRKLGLSQVSGRVSIGTEDSSCLIERSSREGLEHNGAFDRLKKLIRNLLTHVEQRRLDFREKAGLSRRRNASIESVKAIAIMPATSQALTNLPTQFQEPFRKAIEKDVSALMASLEEMDEYQKLLQSRASLGLVVAQVIHEGRRILNPMASASKALYDQREWILESSKRGEVFRSHFPKHALAVQEGARSMSRLFKRLNPVSGRRRGQPTTFRIDDPIKAALDLFSDSIHSNRIDVEVEGLHAHQAYGYVEDLQAAALNIIENAVHWLSTSLTEPRTIRLLSQNFDEQLRIAITNNGPLIDDDYVPRLFQPGFSLKTEGTGLGLSIAREACRASKGDLIFLEGAPETCFIIQFPNNNGKQ